MDRFLYEHSISERGYLIIPYVQSSIAGQPVYSYKLLSELGHKGQFHKTNNPSGLYSETAEAVVEIAKEHLKNCSEINTQSDYFKQRYIYKNTLIIVLQHARRYFYDHYHATELVNIAAPKIFHTEAECMNWIKQGLDRNYPNPAIADS